METNRRLAVLFATVLTALIGTGTAWGKCRHQPKGNPAVQEYVEHIPTVCGPKASGRGGPTTSLPSTILRRLGSGPDAALLRDVATSEKWGAPQTKIRKFDSDGPTQTGRNPIAASLGAVTGGSNGRLIEVLALMAVIAAAAAGAHARRRRIGR